MPDLAQIQGLGARPIADDNPVGDDAKYDDRYEAIVAEIAKLTDLNKGVDQVDADGNIVHWKPTDWTLVADSATELLREQTKDLKLATFLAWAMYETVGWPGFGAALRETKEMLDAFSEALHPTRERARTTAIRWLSEQAKERLESEDQPTPSADEKTGLETSLGALKDLIEVINAKFEDPSVAPYDLQKILERRLASVNAALAESDAAANGEAGAAGTSASAPLPAGAPGFSAASASAQIQTREQAFDALQKIAEFLEKTEPHSPTSLLVKRAVKWGHMSFEEVFAELLTHSTDARKHIWETLGLPDPNQS